MITGRTILPPSSAPPLIVSEEEEEAAPTGSDAAKEKTKVDYFLARVLEERINTARKDRKKSC